MRKAVRAIIVQGNQALVMHRSKFGQEYYILLGGGIDPGETPEQALTREVMEESGIQVGKMRLVFIEEAGDPYGTQYIYLCESNGSEPRLSPDSDEAQIHLLGQNLYTPMWVPIEDFDTLEFRSKALQQVLIQGFKHGFPERPVLLDSLYLDKIQAGLAGRGY